jgi:tRNA (cmo5U34)-methyltransferase
MKPFDFDAEYGAGYDTLIRQVVPGYDDLHLAVLAALAPAPDGADVMVVGVGSGSELVTLGRGRPGWRLTGVEPSDQMIRISRARLDRAGIGDRVMIHHGYVDDLPAGTSFDAATLICVLHFLPDDGAKLGLLRSIAERLRPGALLALVDCCGEAGTAAFARAWDGWMEFIRQKGLTGGERDAYRRQVEEGVIFVPDRRIVELLETAGFTDVQPFYRAFVFGGWLATRG